MRANLRMCAARRIARSNGECAAYPFRTSRRLYAASLIVAVRAGDDGVQISM